jgi:hypothetical protein
VARANVDRILQPGGVVEFLEVDPRPRAPFVGPTRECSVQRRTEAATNWTDRLLDRLEDTCDAEGQNPVPGWTARVEEYLRAALRPRDGVPAEKLKTWLEATG